MGEWGWFAVTALGGSVVLLAAMTAGRRGGGRARRRAGEPDEGDDSAVASVALTEALSAGLPGEQRDREEILPELTRAGIYGPAALAKYRAVRGVLLLGPLFAVAALCLVVSPRLIPPVAVVGALLAAAGFAAPRVYVSSIAQARTREIERGLPVVADMVSMALLSGQGLIAALTRVAAQLRNAFPRLAEELGIVVRQTELYNLSLAVERWADRSQSPDVRNLSLILVQAERLGTDASAGLLEYATNMRVGARQRLEARAQRATFWMLFPTIFCMWLPAAVVLVAPILAEFSLKREKAKDQLQPLPPNSKIGKALGAPGGK